MDTATRFPPANHRRISRGGVLAVSRGRWRGGGGSLTQVGGFCRRVPSGPACRTPGRCR
jgi:hypothetical protein